MTVVADKNTALGPDVRITPKAQRALLSLPVKNTSINVPIKQTTTVQKRNAAEGDSSGFFFFFFWLAIPPTHAAALSANISHPNGKRLFGEELHIGRTSLNPPIEYQSPSCFVSFSSIAGSSLVPRVNRNWPETSSRFQQRLQYFLI